MGKPSTEQRLTKVKTLVNQGRIVEAISLCENILADFPKNSRAKEHLTAILSKSYQKAENNQQEITRNYLIGLFNKGAFHSVIELGMNISRKFPNSIFLLKIIGVSAAQVQKLDLAYNAFRKIIKIDSNDFEAHYNLGNILVSQEQKPKAIESFKTAINLNPKYARAYNNLGSLYFERNETKMAITAFKKAVFMEPMFNEPILNINRIWEQISQHNTRELTREQTMNWLNLYLEIGRVYAENNNLDMAVKAFEKAVEIEPLSAIGYCNLGTALYEQGDFSEAEVILTKSISFDERTANAHNSLGLVKKELGKLNEAIHEFCTAGKLDKKSISISENFADLFVQIHSSQSVIFSSSSTKELINRLNETISLKVFIYLAILAFIQGNFVLCRQKISDFEEIYESLYIELNKQDKKFCSAFHGLLKKLTENFGSNVDEEVRAKIYHLGDSHCLSFAHCKIMIGEKLFQIQPKITFGAKAYHLGLSSENKYKAITKLHFESIPKSSKVLISFGEIDCRPDEGMILASDKLNLSIDELAHSTIERYLNWFQRLNSESNHELYFLNVPAPVKREGLPDSANKLLAETVNIFNRTLKKLVKYHSFKLIDVYSLTVTDTYFANRDFHIDSVHLGNEILPKIQKIIV